jgi:hypothetical protein
MVQPALNGIDQCNIRVYQKMTNNVACYNYNGVVMLRTVLKIFFTKSVKL